MQKEKLNLFEIRKYFKNKNMIFLWIIFYAFKLFLPGNSCDIFFRHILTSKHLSITKKFRIRLHRGGFSQINTDYVHYFSITKYVRYVSAAGGQRDWTPRFYTRPQPLSCLPHTPTREYFFGV